MEKLLTKILFFLTWTFLIFIAITLPVYSEPIDSGLSIYDKVIHFILFGIFFTSLATLFSDFFKLKQIKINKKKLHFLVFLITLAYILLGEYIQQFIPGRNVSIWDVFSALTGVAFFYYFWLK